MKGSQVDDGEEDVKYITTIKITSKPDLAVKYWLENDPNPQIINANTSRDKGGIQFVNAYVRMLIDRFVELLTIRKEDRVSLFIDDVDQDDIIINLIANKS